MAPVTNQHSQAGGSDSSSGALGEAQSSDWRKHSTEPMIRYAMLFSGFVGALTAGTGRSKELSLSPVAQTLAI